MSLCRLLCLDFVEGIGQFDHNLPRYDSGDAQIGIWYAEDLLAQGYAREPFYNFDLIAFKRFCQTKI
jgi:hypothetical protein